MVALPPNHRLADEEAIPISALATERLLLLEDGHCLRDQPWRCAAVAQRSSRSERVRRNSRHTLVQMVASGLGISPPPKLAVSAGIAEGTGLVLRALAGPGAWRTLGLAWRPNAPRAADYRVLAPHLVDTCRPALEPQSNAGE